VADLRTGLTCGSVILKIASSQAEIESAQRLRFKIFNQELGEGIPENAQSGLDQDNFDVYCDHLLVQSPTGETVGTYRLLPGTRRPPQGFYTETEFDLSALTYERSKIVELGRACIHPEFRKQSTLMALFFGLREYVRMTGAVFLLGCGSLPKMTNDDAEASFQSLIERGYVNFQMGAKPLDSHSFQGDSSLGQVMIPQLVNFYLSFGAKVLGRPAFDPVFSCYDLLMFFDMEHLSQWGVELLERYDRRYGSGA
jgi:putative hemolysin